MIPVIAANGWRRVETVFEVDWTNKAPGVGSMTGTGTLYERLSSQYTVQTSPTTVSTDSGLSSSSSVPVGKNNTSPGLVIDEARTSVVSNNRDVSAWTNGGGGTVTANATAGPDGSILADRSQTTSGNPGYHLGYGRPGGITQTISIWHKAGSVGATSQITNDTGGVTFQILFAGTAPTNWTRATYVNTGGAGSTGPILRGADGNNRTSSGGLGAGARDTYLDLLDIQGSAASAFFPTETILGAVTRAAPRWYRNVGNTCLAEDGSLRCYIECEPKGAFNEYSADMTLWYIDASNNCVIDNATQAVKITIGGTLYTTPNTMSWAREDRLRIFVCVGGGQVTSVQYAVNASSPVRISTGSPPTFGALMIPGTLDFLQSNKAKVFSARIQRLRFYKYNKKPSDF